MQRLYTGIKMDEGSQEIASNMRMPDINKVNSVVRGLLEIIGLGALLFVVDIIMTLKKMCTKES